MLPKSFRELIPDDPELRAIYARWHDERPGHRTCLLRWLQAGQLDCQPCAQWGLQATDEQQERLELRDKAERQIRGALVDTSPALPPPRELEMELPKDDATRGALLNEWGVSAWRRTQSLLPKGVELTGVCEEPRDLRLEFQLEFADAEFLPILLIRVKATVTLTAVAEVIPQDGWRLTAEARGGVWIEDYPDEASLGFLPKPIAVSQTDLLAVPLAVLGGLASRDFAAPGARPVAIGKRGATWLCGESKFALPSWLVGLLRGKDIGESMALLGVPEAFLTAVLDSARDGSALDLPPGSRRALPMDTTGPSPEVMAEAIEALVPLGYSKREAGELVEDASRGLSATASKEDIVFVVLRSVETG